MEVHLVRPRDLTPNQLAAWLAIQSANGALDSPFFCPEFSQTVGDVREDLEIAVLEEAGQLAGFFPFHRTHNHIGRPVGLRLSDLHGAIIDPEVEWCAGEVIEQCGLVAWHFDHLIASQSAFEPFQWNEAGSPFMDLSAGFEAYCAERGRAGSQLIPQILRKSRKAQRELGPLQFTVHSSSALDIETLIDWKSEQHRRTGVLEIFRYPWVLDLVRRVWLAQYPGFGGILSTLSAGDRLLAVHLGLRSATVWHVWFPAFDRMFARYSPGLILLLEMARAAESHGVRRIDLGKGSERYKASLMSGADRLFEGSVDCRPIMRNLRRGWHGTKHWIRSSRLRAPLNAPLRLTRRFRQWMAFR